MFRKTLPYFLIFPVVILGLYNRLIGIIAGNFGFTFDQGRDLLAASSITQGKITLIGPTTGLAGVYHGPLWYYILAFLSFLGNGNPKIILAGIVGLFFIAELILFKTIKHFWGAWTGFAFLAIVSVSPFFVSNNGQLWSPIMTIFSMLFALTALVGIANGKKLYWLLGLALGANMQFEAAGGIFLFLATVLTLFLVRPPKVRLRDYLKFGLAFVVTLIPQILFEIRHGFLMTKLILEYIRLPQTDFIADYGTKTVEYKTGLFFDLFDKLFFPHNLALTFLLILILFVGFMMLLRKKRGISRDTRLILTWIFSITVIVWISANLYKGVVWGHFLFGIADIYLVGLVLLMHNLKRQWPIITSVLAGLLLVWLAIPYVKPYSLETGISGDQSYYKNQLTIINTIYSDSQNQPFNVEVYDPTTFSYNYDYLFSWYGKNKFGKVPVDNLTPVKLVYFIVESDDIAGRKERWLKDRDGDGEIIWTKYFWKVRPDSAGQLMLQKRIRNI